MDKFCTFLAIVICIQILIPVTISISPRASKHRSEFGEICNKTVRCKSQSWLTCDTVKSLCTCAKPDEMIYDTVKRKCVAMIGEQCKYSFGSENENVGLFYERVDCVNNAECGTDGTCACPFGTYEIPDENKCAPVKSHGGICQLTAECDQTLSCLNSTCKCATDDMLFDDLIGACRIKAGGKCIYSRPGIDVSACVNGSECDFISTICTCIAGMYMNSGKCIQSKGWGWHCSSSEECDNSQMLTCIKKRCECDPIKATYITRPYEVNSGSSYSSYTVPSEICVSKVGKRCRSDGVNAVYCIPNGFCTLDSVCTCEEGYSETSDGLCGLGYDRICSDSDVCGDKLTCKVISDQYRNWQARCLCPDSEFQVYTNNICQGVLGGPCDSDNECVKNAHCVESTQSNQVRSVCECQEGFVEYDSNTCDISYGLECRLPEPHCDRNSELVCTKRIGDSKFRCNCPNVIDVFNSSVSKCQTPVGFKCQHDENCIANATCLKMTGHSSSGRCTCKSGFQLIDENRKCIPDSMTMSFLFDAI